MSKINTHAEANIASSSSESTDSAVVNPKVRVVEIDDNNEGQRIDNYLLSVLKGVPKSHIYRILRKGEVRVNKGRIKPEYKLQDGDTVRIPPVRISPTSEPAKPSKQLSQCLEAAILYENDEVLVINKPSGLAVHGGSGVRLGLIESLRQMRPDSRFLELVHRLDKDTSGCIMVAKKRSCLRHLQQELRERRINKIYQALVLERWPNRRRRVNLALVKNKLANGGHIVKGVPPGSREYNSDQYSTAQGNAKKKPSRNRPSGNAEETTNKPKESLTEYRIIKRYTGNESSDTCTLVEAKPVTGRTHQIRVHCQSLGCAIIGDDKYGNEAINKRFRHLGLKRLFLHAYRLEFTLTDKTPVVVEAPLASDLTAVFNHLTESH